MHPLMENPEESKESKIWGEAQKILDQTRTAMLKKVGSIMPGTMPYDTHKLEQAVYDLFSHFKGDWFKDQITNTVLEELDSGIFKDMLATQVKYLVNASIGHGWVYGIGYFASVIDEVLASVE